jgi:O-antigen/teichoic acid export membrane protein
MLTRGAIFKAMGRMIGKLLGSRLVMDSFWSLFGNVMSKGLALAAGIVVARLLGKDIFGSYGIIKTTLLSLAVFSSFGLGYTTTKFLAETSDNLRQSAIVKHAYWISLGFGTVIALLLAWSAEWLALQVLNAPTLTSPLRFLAFLVVCNAIIAAQVGIFSGLGKFKELARINTCIGFVTFFSSFILATLYGFEGALAALALSQLVNLIFNFFGIKKLLLKVNQKINRNLFQDMLKFSIPVALQEGVYIMTSWLVAYLVILSSDFGEFGMYTAAMQWNAVVLFVPGILSNVILSHLSAKSSDVIKHQDLLKSILTINAFTTLLPALAVAFFSSFIAKLYGPSFYGLGGLISLSVLSSVMMSISNLYSQAYLSKGLNWQMFGFRVLRDVGILFLTYGFLTYLINFPSAAYAPIISALLMHSVFLLLMIGFYRYKRKWT